MAKVKNKSNKNHDLKIKFGAHFSRGTFYDVLNISAKKSFKIHVGLTLGLKLSE
jgi:hypothetical protein